MTKKTVEVNEAGSYVNTFVDTLWNQYEQGLEWSSKLRESSEDAYLKAVKDAINLNKGYRNSLVNLYQESKNTNTEIVKGLSSRIGTRAEHTEELTEKMSEVSGRLENLALTPLELTFEWLDRFDSKFEENSENLIHYAREQRISWQNVTNGYIESARNNQKKLFSRFEESIKVLTNAK